MTNETGAAGQLSALRAIANDVDTLISRIIYGESVNDVRRKVAGYLERALAAAAPKPADLGQEQTHFCQNTKQIELTSLSACSCVEPDAPKPAPACEAPPFREVVEWLHHLLAAAQNLPYKEGDVCLECADVVRDQLVPLMVRALAASVPPPTGGK